MGHLQIIKEPNNGGGPIDFGRQPASVIFGILQKKP